jgi:hypothetical protein
VPIDLLPQPLCLLWREGHVPSSEEDCGGIKRVYGSIRLGFYLLVVGDWLFLFDTVSGHGGRTKDGRGVPMIARYFRERGDNME